MAKRKNADVQAGIFHHLVIVLLSLIGESEAALKSDSGQRLVTALRDFHRDNLQDHNAGRYTPAGPR